MKEIVPKTNQIFYVLFDEENNMLHSITKETVFTTPFITKAMVFESKELCVKFIDKNKLNFKTIRVKPKYELL